MTATLRGQVAIVTGAGRGIGRETALALAEAGMQVALVARTGRGVHDLAEQVRAGGGEALPVALDVRDPAGVERLLALVEQRLGPVDLLVNSAGVVGSERPFWEVDAAESWAVVETNLRGPMLLARGVLPSMVARRRGRIVSITSRARAATATGTYTAYAVSKRALTALTEALAVPLAPTGVVVLDVLPGLVRTDMTAAMPVWQSLPEEAWTPASATAALLVEIARGRFDDRSGQVLDASAG